MSTPAPTTLSVLQALPRTRLLDLARDLSVPIRPEDPASSIATALSSAGRVELRALVESLGRDELKAVLRSRGRSEEGRSRPALASRVLGISESELTAHQQLTAPPVPDAPPRPGDIVRACHRQCFWTRPSRRPSPTHVQVHEMAAPSDCGRLHPSGGVPR